MTWARVSSISIACAVALILIANAPAVLMDPLFLAIAQIRVNAAATQVPVVQEQQTSEMMSSSTTSARKAK